MSQPIQVLRTAAISYAVFLRPGQLFRFNWPLLLLAQWCFSSLLYALYVVPAILSVAWFSAAVQPEDAIVPATALQVTPETWSMMALTTLVFGSISAAVLTLLFGMAAAPWQRAVIVGPGNVPGLFPYRLRLAELSWWLRFLLLAVAAVLVVRGLTAAVTGTFPGSSPLWYYRVAALAVELAVLYPLARLSMSLPAAAMGHDASFTRSLALTRGNGLRLVAVAALTILPGRLPFYLGGFFVGLSHAWPGTHWYLGYLNSFVFTVCGITALSLCYRQLSGGGRTEA